MAGKSTTSGAPFFHQFSAPELEAHIRRLQATIRRLQEFPVASIGNDVAAPEVGGLRAEVQQRIDGAFGNGTVEAARYVRATALFPASRSVYGTTAAEAQADLAARIKTSIVLLEQAVTALTERLEDLGAGSPAERALRAYEGLELHAEIERAAGQLYRDGHYANAVEDAVKALNALVRMRSGVEDRDGSPLMEFVFSPGKPVLRFNDLQDQSDRDEQKGFMMLFSGTVAGLRNPRAHKLIQDDDPERALEFIAFVSLLAKLLDGAKKDA
jgi:uncharacterized protein (TIGR02391 family)